MFKLVVVWLLSNGQFESLPWQNMPDYNSCQRALQVIEKSGNDERLLFSAGCLRGDLMHQFTGIEFTLKNAEDGTP